ncbi:hypothetical protein BU202_04590 [Streptococcus cuniculi]|uniref:Uncharacterized protein n=1 Tax=Streptococcus cuniculi TaxID=1432788 RepID=A0A1Q8E906_9STRE|nr:hypothetical protein [Streptococcus cuniculi]OLF48275.1 hypothetical protein BU202_04590 [Streptococcus cuniculi]
MLQVFSQFSKKHALHLILFGFFIWIAPYLMLFVPKMIREPFFATADWYAVTIVWLVPIIGILAFLCSLYLKRKKYLFFSACLILAQPISYLLWIASFYLFVWGYGFFYWISQFFR